MDALTLKRDTQIYERILHGEPLAIVDTLSGHIVWLVECDHNVFAVVVSDTQARAAMAVLNDLPAIPDIELPDAYGLTKAEMDAREDALPPLEPGYALAHDGRVVTVGDGIMLRRMTLDDANDSTLKICRRVPKVVAAM